MPPNPEETVAANVRHLRTARGLTQGDLADMRAAADAYAQRARTSPPGNFGDAHGVTHAFQSMTIGPNGEIAAQSEAAALIRLWRQRLGTGVVTHEVARRAHESAERALASFPPTARARRSP